MKKIYLSLICLFTITSGFAQIPTPTLNIGITSHNEMTTAEAYNTYTFFIQTRDTLRKIIDLINTKNAKYNLQTCQKFVLGSLQHESAATTNTDILQYAYQLGGTPYGNIVEIDPRYKTQAPTFTYNIADVAALIDSTGAKSSKTLGGFVHFPFPGDWAPFTTTVTGVFNKPWKADILWGAGTGTPYAIHSRDANNYGQWKPRSDADSINFYCHDPSKTQWLQGNGCAWNLDPTANIQTIISEIRSEATKIKNGTYPANKFYNASLMINFKDFQSPGFRAKLTTIIDSINVLVSQGKVNWKTIGQKHTAFVAWTGSTSIAYSQWRCGQTTTLTPTCIQSGLSEQEFENQIALYPNPTTNQLNINVSSAFNTEEVLVFNNIGQICKRVQVNKKETSIKFDVSDLPKGVYLIRIDKRTTRFIKE
ncbi:MAG: T9SS type A sorting domain-containing protein [Sphingobacteriaceae bacterium]